MNNDSASRPCNQAVINSLRGPEDQLRVVRKDSGKDGFVLNAVDILADRRQKNLQFSHLAMSAPENALLGESRPL